MLLAPIFLTAAPARPVLEAVTFFPDPGVLYVPLEEAARELRWEPQRNEAGQCVRLQGAVVPPGSLRRLPDGTELVGTWDLQRAGAEVGPGAEAGAVVVRRGFRAFDLKAGPKQVEINLARQQLRGWQGSRLVIESRISSGRRGSTPTGSFRAGPFRARMHYSSRYHHAPMPWSVQIKGHVFIHGFTSVPNFPASHGCIRLPLDGNNPARFFFEWIDNGSPVRIVAR
jgi:hypothetical protein